MGLAQHRESATNTCPKAGEHTQLVIQTVTKKGRKSPCRPPELALFTLGTLRITRLSTDAESATRDSNAAGTIGARGLVICPRGPEQTHLGNSILEQPLPFYLAGASPQQPQITCSNPHGTATNTLAMASLCPCRRLSTCMASLWPLCTRHIGCSGKKRGVCLNLGQHQGAGLQGELLLSGPQVGLPHTDAFPCF